MFGFLTSVFSGGLTGIIGSAITGFTEYKNKKLDHENEMAKLEHDERMMTLEFDNRIKVIDKEADVKIKELITTGDIEIEKIDSQAFQESFKADRATYATGDKARNSYLFMLIDFLRGLIRPVLTIYLVVLVTYFYIDLQKVLDAAGSTFSTKEALPVIVSIIDMILYLCTTVVLWWFGTRNKNKKTLKG